MNLRLKLLLNKVLIKVVLKVFENIICNISLFNLHIDTQLKKFNLKIYVVFLGFFSYIIEVEKFIFVSLQKKVCYPSLNVYMSGQHITNFI